MVRLEASTRRFVRFCRTTKENPAMHPAGTFATLATLGILLLGTAPVGIEAMPQVDETAVNKAVDRAVTFLKRNQAPDGTWYHQYAAPAAGIQVDQNLGA